MQNIAEEIISNPLAFLHFMQDNKYPVIHDSNLFFRDIEFAIAKWITAKTGKTVEYFGSVEKMAREACAGMERAGILKSVSRNAYLLNAKEFIIQRPVKEEPKPASLQPTAATAAEAAA